MATRTWNSSGSTDMNDGSNYTPTGAILASDFLVFDGTSVVNATATGSLSAATIDVIAAYTGAWNDGGQTITLVNSFNMSSGGAFTASGTFNMTANGDLTYNPDSKSTSSWTVDLRGTGTFAVTGYIAVGKMICAYSGKITTLTGSGIALNAVQPLTLNGGTLTNNQAGEFRITCSSNYIIDQGSSTINGTGTITLSVSSSATATIKTFNYTGTGTIFLRSYTTGSNNNITLEGNFTTSGSLVIARVSETGSYNFNVAGYTMTANSSGKTLCVGQQTAAAGPTIINLQGGEINAAQLRTYGNGGWTDDMCTINLDTGQIILSNNPTDIIKFNDRIVFTQSAKEDSIYLFPANSGKITTSGSIMPSLRMNGSGKTFTLQDDYASLNGYGSIRIGVGTFDTNEKIVICGKDLIVDATETADFTASVISIYGNYGSYAGSTVTIDASTEFKFYGTNTITTNGVAMPKTTLFGNATINDSCTIARLIMTGGKTTTFETGETFTITAYTAADWDGTSGPLRTILRSATPATPFTIVMPSDLAMNYVDAMDCTSDTHTMTVAFGVDGTGNTNWVFTKIDGGAWYSYAQQ